MTQWWFPLWPLAWALLIGAAGPETSDGDYRPARYGAQDVIGAANNLGSDIVKATAGLVQSGKVYSLAINSGNPFPNRDHAVQVERLHSPGAAVNNDTLAMWIGVFTTSINVLGHAGRGDRFYNSNLIEDVRTQELARNHVTQFLFATGAPGLIGTTQASVNPIAIRYFLERNT